MKKVIIIPTYNERRNIGEIVPILFEKVPDAKILIVDDNSPDGTQEKVKEMQKVYANLRLLHRSEKKGLGKAYINAFSEVLKNDDVDLVVMMDADFSHDPNYLPQMISIVENNEADVVVGSRYVKGGGTIGWEKWRKLLSYGGNIYSRLVTGIPVRDSTAGFYVINTTFLKKLNYNNFGSSGYAFQIELKFALHRAKARIKEFPIIFTNRKDGESKMSGHIIREAVIAPWKIRWYTLRNENSNNGR